MKHILLILIIQAATAYAQIRYVQVGNLPIPTASDRVEVYDTESQRLFSFPTYNNGYVTNGYISQQVTNDNFSFITIPGLAAIYWGRVATDGTNVYSVGGYGTPGYNVQYAPISSISQSAIWNSTTIIPNLVYPVGRALHQAFIYNGYLYILGGYCGDNLPPYSDVWYAPILPGGALGSFIQTTSLPTGMYGHATAVSTDGNVYVASENNLLCAKIAVDGSIGYWSAQSSIPQMNYKNYGNTGMAIISNLLVVADSSNTFVCTLSVSGQINSLAATLANPIVQRQWSVYANNGKIYLTGTSGNIYRLDGLFNPPFITQQPTNQIVVDNGAVAFSVAVSGVGPFSYQWQLNGTNISPGITTVAGDGTYSSDGSGVAATNTGMGAPWGISLDNAGNLFIADFTFEEIRKVDTNGIITRVAGNGNFSYSGDGGAATNAGLKYPHDVFVDGAHNLYIADSSNSRIRKVDTNGIITTVAGNGSSGYFGDGGAATNAQINYPQGVSVDGAGNLFIADTSGARIRKVSTNGIITTVAGNGISSYSGDGGAATNTTLNSPASIVFDNVGNLLIADTANNRVRKIATSGIITTVAGNGVGGYSGDGGAAINAQLKNPNGVFVDDVGNIFIADTDNYRIRRVDCHGIITTVAGIGTIGYSGDGGAAINAQMSGPNDVAEDGVGNLFITDWRSGFYSNRIRKVNVSSMRPSLTMANISKTIAGNYSVIISSSFGSVTSSFASLIVAPAGYNQISGSLLIGDKLRLSFVGLQGTNYALDRSFSLSPANWIPQITNPADANGNLIFTNAPDPTTNNFWRIRSVP